jgi:hypothetical protein
LFVPAREAPPLPFMSMVRQNSFNLAWFFTSSITYNDEKIMTKWY